MKNTIQIFNNPDFGQVRTVTINEKDYFYGVDVATALAYERPSKAVSDHCKGILTWDTIKNAGGYPEKLILIGDVCRLIVKASEQSQNKEIKDKAEKFERWVYDEVLPSIHDNGTYCINTTYKSPIPPSTLESATNAGRLFERIMRNEGAPPYEIAMAVRDIFLQAGINVPDYVVRIPSYEQLAMTIGKNGEVA